MNRAFHDSLPPAAGLPSQLGLFQERFGRSWGGSRLGRLAPAILVVLLWTAVGLFQSVPEMIRGFHGPVLISKLFDNWAWALLTPAILLLDRRLTSAQQNVVRLAALHLLLSVPISLIHTGLAGLFLYPLQDAWWSPLRNTDFIVYYFLGGWVTYCAFVAIIQAFKFYNRSITSQVALERVEKRLLESQLNALRLQLEPHFLFNTLNAISSEVATDPTLAREMIEDLGALLRRSLDCQDSVEITLAQELALLDHYLAIQRLRFGKRIDIRIDVEPAMLSSMVPSMLLQPLVENAIRHGLESRLSGGMVAISAQQAGHRLRIIVSDDGVGLPAKWQMEACAGLGVRVTRERLEALYSGTGENGFTISRRDGGGTEVTIYIPLERSGVEARGIAV